MNPIIHHRNVMQPSASPFLPVLYSHLTSSILDPPIPKGQPLLVTREISPDSLKQKPICSPEAFSPRPLHTGHNLLLQQPGLHFCYSSFALPTGRQALRD